MANSTENEGELSPLERSLASLRPAPAAIDRDEVLFQAGRAAAVAQQAATQTSRVRLWQLATAAMLLLSLTTTTLWLADRQRSEVAGSGGTKIDDHWPDHSPAVQPEKTDTLIDDTVPGTDTGNRPSHDAPPSDYLALRQFVLRNGAEALPAPAATSASETPRLPAWRDGLRDRRLIPRSQENDPS